MSKSIASTSEPPSSLSKEAQRAETESVVENPAMTAICAFVNDRENRILGSLVDRLGSLESGALLPLEEEPPELGGGRHYIIHLDTKYYTSQVHVGSWATLDAFTTALKLRPQMQVYALMVCAESEELNQQFLCKVAQFVGALETLEVKAMVIKIKEPPIFGQSDNGSKNKTAGVVSDTDLSQFSFNRGIELIHVWEGKKPHSDADFRPEEEGSFGIGRVQEVLETVRWPGLQCKPNPIGRSEHRRRLNDYVNELDEEEDAWEAATTLREAKTALADGDEDRDFRFLPPSLEAKMVGGGGAADFLPFVMSAATTSAGATTSTRDGQGSSNSNNKDGTATDGEAKTGENAIAAAAGDDYPDTEDEEAILQWFDRPFSHQFQVNDFPSTFVGQPWPPHATTTAGGTAPLMATAPPLPPMFQQQQRTWQQPWREDMARKIKEAEEKRLAQASATSARARTTTSANVRGTTTTAAATKTTSATTTTSEATATTTSEATTTAAPTLATLRKRPTATKSKQQQQQQQKKREKSREADDAEECCGEDEEEEEEHNLPKEKELTRGLNLHPLKVINMADAVGLDMLQLGQLMGGGSSSSRRDGTDHRKPREDQRQSEEGKEEKKTQPKGNAVATASDRMTFPTMHSSNNSSSNSSAMEKKTKGKGQPGNGGGKRTAAAGGKSHDE